MINVFIVTLLGVSLCLTQSSVLWGSAAACGVFQKLRSDVISTFPQQRSAAHQKDALWLLSSFFHCHRQEPEGKAWLSSHCLFKERKCHRWHNVNNIKAPSLSNKRLYNKLQKYFCIVCYATFLRGNSIQSFLYFYLWFGLDHEWKVMWVMW